MLQEASREKGDGISDYEMMEVYTKESIVI